MLGYRVSMAVARVMCNVGYRVFYGCCHGVSQSVILGHMAFHMLPGGAVMCNVGS